VHVFRRLLVATTVAGVAAVALGGCSAQTTRKLSRQEIVVIFAADRTGDDVARVRARCDGVGGAKVEQVRAGAAGRAYPLRFDVTGLSPQQEAQLSSCLAGDRSVQGLDTAGAGD
jgi:ribonuclease I